MRIGIPCETKRRAAVPLRRAVDYLALNIDAPPSVNAAYANVPGKGRVKTRAYREWKERAAWQVEAQRPGRIEGAYRIKIAVRRASLRRDLGNFEKLISDLLVSCGVLDDDKHAEKIELSLSDSVRSGCQVIVSRADYGRAAAA